MALLRVDMGDYRCSLAKHILVNVVRTWTWWSWTTRKTSASRLQETTEKESSERGSMSEAVGGMGGRETPITQALQQLCAACGPHWQSVWPELCRRINTGQKSAGGWRETRPILPVTDWPAGFTLLTTRHTYTCSGEQLREQLAPPVSDTR